MQIIIGTLCISLAVFTFCIVLIGFRNPRQPFWASDSWVGNCHSIVILALGLIGILTLGLTLFKHQTDAINNMDILISALIVLATAFGVKAMHIKKRLAEFERLISIKPKLVHPAPSEAKNGTPPSTRKIAA